MTTVIAFHAHPDDEVLITGGTIAKLAADGHRVVIVTVSDGFMCATTEPGYRRRLAELDRSAAILGAARVVCLGYADSGHGPLFFEDPPDRVRFACAPVDEAAVRLLAVIREEDARLLLSYEPGGHYGHRDHIRVHQVGARAAELAGDIRVLEATAPKLALRLLSVVSKRDVVAPVPPRRIAHRVNVRRYARRKREALAAHESPISKAGLLSPLAVFARLPLPLFSLVAGREWFAESQTPASRVRSPRSLGPFPARLDLCCWYLGAARWQTQVCRQAGYWSSPDQVIRKVAQATPWLIDRGDLLAVAQRAVQCPA